MKKEFATVLGGLGEMLEKHKGDPEVSRIIKDLARVTMKLSNNEPVNVYASYKGYDVLIPTGWKLKYERPQIVHDGEHYIPWNSDGKGWGTSVFSYNGCDSVKNELKEFGLRRFVVVKDE